MSILFALLVLVIIVAIAFWIVNTIQSKNSGLPAIAFTIAYIIIGVFALFALYVIASGALTLPALK